MPALPNVFSIQMGIGSQWSQSYTFQNADGSLVDLTGHTFSFVVRNDPSEPNALTPAIKVDTTGTSQGSITVNVPTATITVNLLASATGTLTQKVYYYSLWMDPGTTSVAWATGTIFAAQIANY